MGLGRDNYTVHGIGCGWMGPLCFANPFPRSRVTPTPTQALTVTPHGTAPNRAPSLPHPNHSRPHPSWKCIPSHPHPTPPIPASHPARTASICFGLASCLCVFLFIIARRPAQNTPQPIPRQPTPPQLTPHHPGAHHSAHPAPPVPTLPHPTRPSSIPRYLVF